MGTRSDARTETRGESDARVPFPVPPGVGAARSWPRSAVGRTGPLGPSATEPGGRGLLAPCPLQPDSLPEGPRAVWGGCMCRAVHPCIRQRIHGPHTRSGVIFSGGGGAIDPGSERDPRGVGRGTGGRAPRIPDPVPVWQRRGARWGVPAPLAGVEAPRLERSQGAAGQLRTLSWRPVGRAACGAADTGTPFLEPNQSRRGPGAVPQAERRPPPLYVLGVCGGMFTRPHASAYRLRIHAAGDLLLVLLAVSRSGSNPPPPRDGSADRGGGPCQLRRLRSGRGLVGS